MLSLCRIFLHQKIQMYFSVFLFILFAFIKIHARLNQIVFRTIGALLYRYISANVSETGQVKTMFASIFNWNVSGKVEFYILPGAFSYFDAGSWPDL